MHDAEAGPVNVERDVVAVVAPSDGAGWTPTQRMTLVEFAEQLSAKLARLTFVQVSPQRHGMEVTAWRDAEKCRAGIDIRGMEPTLSCTMRGADKKQSSMLMLMSPETRVPEDHPLRAIKKLADEALTRVEMLDNNVPGMRRITVAGDKGYDTSDFVEACRSRNVTLRIPLNLGARSGRTRPRVPVTWAPIGAKRRVPSRRSEATHG